MSGTAVLERKITTDVKINLDGYDVADLFWCLDSTEQAKFFNSLGGNDRLVFQLQAVTDDDALNATGRHCMGRIGDYA